LTGSHDRRAQAHEGIREGKPGPSPGQRDSEGRFDFLRDRVRRSNEEVVHYIESRKDRWGVEPICKAPQFAPATYYAALKRPLSARAIRDEELVVAITHMHAETALRRRQGLEAASLRGSRRGALHRRASDASRGSRGRSPGRHWKTTIPDEHAPRPADLVQRDFSAPAPNRRWVADLTYVKTYVGFVDVAFIIDVFSRFIVGWQVSTRLRSDLALDALEMAIHSWRVDERGQLINHHDRRVQYVSLRYAHRLIEAGIAASVGSKGDSYNNAPAESFNGLYKAELIYHEGPLKGIEDVEVFYNRQRRHSSLDYVSPIEFELSFKEEKTA